MEYIVTGREMKAYDSNTTEHFRIPSLVLMERAAVCTCDVLLKKSELKRFLILCGMGNNGGDGLAIARILFTKGYEVKVLLAGNADKMSPETRAQYESALKYGILMEDASVSTDLLSKEYDCVVDAVFGISLNRSVEGIYAEVIKKANKMQAYKISVDIPSGIHADTGMVLGISFTADATVTFGFKKTGLFLGEAKAYCGKVICADIGITKESFLDREPKGFSFDKTDLKRIPKRSTTSNKGSFGKLLVIAGSKEIGGAAVLSALSAYRSGCGYVRVLTEETNRDALLTMLPEAVISAYKDEHLNMETVKKACDFASTVVIGPGLGKSETAEKLVEYVLANVNKPLVIDADAMNLISENESYKELLLKRDKTYPVIMTPHLLELKRFVQKEIGDIKKDILEIGLAVADQYGVILVCKDAVTSVFDGTGYYINQTGNDGLATAGSGDVLAGIIGAMLAKDMNGMEAACISVLLHGLCADYAVRNTGRSYLKAGDLITQLKEMLE